MDYETSAGLELDQKESQTERERDEIDHLCEWQDDKDEIEEQLTYNETEAIRKIRDTAFFAITLFDKGRVNDAIADLTFIKTQAEQLLNEK